ncbi:MAG: Fur family transcriptional regulator [bacterium]
MKSLQDRLKEKEIRPSHHRLKILECLEGRCDHPNVDMLYDCLKEKFPTISKTTIYNTLKVFVDKGVVSGLTIAGNELRYDADITQHAHLMCKSCGRIFDIKDFKCPNIKSEIAGHKIDEAKLYLMGTCKNCAKRGK